MRFDTKSVKRHSREDWARLTPYARRWLRAEYRHLLKSDVHQIIARGTISRTASMFLLVKAGV